MKEEYRIAHVQGDTAAYEWVEVRAAVDERDEAGKAVSLVGSSMTVTQRKKMEEDLIHAKQRGRGGQSAEVRFPSLISVMRSVPR